MNSYVADPDVRLTVELHQADELLLLFVSMPRAGEVLLVVSSELGESSLGPLVRLARVLLGMDRATTLLLDSKP
jgi:hypothetical protein